MTAFDPAATLNYIVQNWGFFLFLLAGFAYLIRLDLKVKSHDQKFIEQDEKITKLDEPIKNLTNKLDSMNSHLNQLSTEIAKCTAIISYFSKHNNIKE